MANLTRILFISGEVAPFAGDSDIAGIVRKLPEKLQETNGYEMRIMMPRYGSISERRNRLHEVIRLSGAEVTMGSEKETLRVKVASIPGIRLQVYFMDNNKYFKRKGVYHDKQGKFFDDNPQRALFFAHATLENIRNLGWSPDIVHTFGSMSALVPVLLRTSYAGDPLFQNAKIIFTPREFPAEPKITWLPNNLKIDSVDLTGRQLSDVALEYADAVIYPPSSDGNNNGELRLYDDTDEMVKQIVQLYDQVLSGVLA